VLSVVVRIVWGRLCHEVLKAERSMRNMSIFVGWWS